MNQFVALGSHTIVLAYQMIIRVVIIMVIQTLTPFSYRLSGKQWLERSARHIGRLLQARQVEEGRSKVDVLYHLVALALRLDMLRIADDERCME